MRKPFDAATFAAKYKAQIEACGRALATDFDTPAQPSINRMFAGIGERRFVGKDDRWEQATAFLDGREYEAPPKAVDGKVGAVLKRYAGRSIAKQCGEPAQNRKGKETGK